MRIFAAGIVALAYLSQITTASAAVFTNFDSFADGNVNGQAGWIATGPYDQGVVDLGGGNKAWRVSNAKTSGSFGDMPFSAPSGTPSGESGAPGAVTNSFLASFDIWSVTGSAQPGLRLTISPDSGNGSRQSYISVDDTGSGLDVTFYDYQTAGSGFVGTLISTGLSYASVHNIAFDISFVSGNTPENDVVQMYVDGSLVHTGTTWEQYYPNLQPSHPSPFAIDRLLFRTSGAAAPGTLGAGFYIDNVSVSAVPEPGSVMVWSLLGLTIGGAGWWRRKRSA